MTDVAMAGARPPGAPIRRRAAQRRCFISPRIYLLIVVSLIGALIALNFVAIAMQHATQSPQIRLLAKIFILDAETNLPTFAAFCLIVFNAQLLSVIAFGAISTRRAWRWHWVLLALVFVAMAFDEAASLHEKVSGLVRPALPDVALLHFAWVVPAGLFVGVFGLSMLRFVLVLPEPVRRMVILSGAIFVAGALGVEMLGGVAARSWGMGSPAYLAVASVEEALEMSGMALFGYALLRLLASPDGRVRLPAPTM